MRSVSTHIIQERLELLDAVAAAVDQCADVTAAIAEAQDRSAARAAVGALLGVDETAVRAVMDLRWEELNVQSRDSLRSERDELASELRARSSGPAGRR